VLGYFCPKVKEKTRKTILNLLQKKRRFSLLNYLNMFIDIPIVAEVERFLPFRLGGFNRGFIVRSPRRTQQSLSCYR
jgi:hypothetical protein